MKVSFNETPKGPSLRQNTRFNPSTMKIGIFVRAVREPEKVNKKTLKKGHERYISPMRGGGIPEGGSRRAPSAILCAPPADCRLTTYTFRFVRLPLMPPDVWRSAISYISLIVCVKKEDS
jgi:hypothetical protein